MTIVDKPEMATLGSEELNVEAGSTAEITIRVTSETGEQEVREYALGVRGLPREWYSLSSRRLRQRKGEGPAEALLVLHPPSDDRAAPPGEYRFAIDVVSQTTGDAQLLEGRVRLLPPGGASLESELLQYLPSVFRGDPFLARFLLIFESLLNPIEESIGNTHHYLDPSLAPAEFLPWLASWVGLDLRPDMSEKSKRELIRRGVEMGRWKGTRHGLREELETGTGARPLIVENFDGMRLGQDACMGLNTHLGVRREQCITVTMVTKAGSTLDRRQADALVEEFKPAYVGHTVRLAPAPGA